MSYNRNLYSSSESAIDAGMIYDQTEEKLQSEINAEVSSDITELDNSLSTFVRPNLLDNWYFVGGGSQLGEGTFPINQRGQGSYTTYGDTIDRWKIANNITLTLSVSCVTIANTHATTRYSAEQSLSSPNDLRGKTVTGSILLADGFLYSGTVNIPSSVPSSSTAISIVAVGTAMELRLENRSDGGIKIFITISALTSQMIQAVKLEIGGTQTLAHQENGEWVLNEIPNWEEEYRKCYGSVKIRNADIDATSATYPSYGNTAGVLFYDKNSYALAMYADRHETDGSTGAIIGGNKRINNSNYWNYLRLLVKPDGTKVVMVTDPAAWRTALIVPADSEVLKKTGGTITGSLGISSTSPAIYMSNTNADVTLSSYTAFNSVGIRLRDANGKNVAIITDRYMADGKTGLWLSGWKTVNGTDVSNGLYLYVDKNGNRVVEVSEGAPWRKAINICYTANETMSVDSSLVLSGFMHSSATAVYLDVHVEKSMENISSVTVTTMQGVVYGVNGKSDDANFMGTSYTRTCKKQGTHHVRIALSKSSAFTNAVGNTPVTYFGTLTLKFT